MKPGPRRADTDIFRLARRGRRSGVARGGRVGAYLRVYPDWRYREKSGKGCFVVDDGLEANMTFLLACDLPRPFLLGPPSPLIWTPWLGVTSAGAHELLWQAGFLSWRTRHCLKRGWKEEDEEGSMAMTWRRVGSCPSCERWDVRGGCDAGMFLCLWTAFFLCQEQVAD